MAFDEIDKAPEEKKRGITIATVLMLALLFLNILLPSFFLFFHILSIECVTGTCGV